MNYLQHFGLKHDPLGKEISDVVHSDQQNRLVQYLNRLLHTKGVGLITGEAGTGKTTALREWVNTLNPMTHRVVYQADNHFKPFDIYCQLADHLGLEQFTRYSRLWRELKYELLNLTDNKQMSVIWILDEAHLLDKNFLAELPSFLNFSFDHREVVTIILVGLPQLQTILKKTVYLPLLSRILFQFYWESIDDFGKFREFLLEAFKIAGKHETIISQSGIQLIYLASKGRLRHAHRILTQSLQTAAESKLNHLPDDVINKAIADLMS